MADQTLHTRLLAEIDSWADVNGRLSPPEAALRAVVELHAPDEHGRCGACTKLVRRAGNHVRWRVMHPCEDIRIIADQLGLEEAT